MVLVLDIRLYKCYALAEYFYFVFPESFERLFLTFRLIVRLVAGHLDNVEDCFFLFVTDFELSRIFLCSPAALQLVISSLEPLSVVITGMCYNVLATELMFKLCCRQLEFSLLPQS